MATEAILNTDGTARPIARMQVVDKETGAKTETDVYTCARAVTCNEGIDLQTHLETLHGHAEDTTAHLTAEEKRGLETTAGAQEKANAALSAAKTYTDTKAVDLAASMNAATSAKIAAALETAAGEAATKANEARAAAVTEATTIATEKAAAAERASAPALHASQHAADGSDPITPPMIGAASNPNLLDNWYFADPVDQRGGYVVPSGTPLYSDSSLTTLVLDASLYACAVDELTSTYAKITTNNGTVCYADATHAVRGYVGRTYGCDRWHCLCDGTGVELIDSNGITLVCGTDTMRHTQYLDNLLHGETVTFSALVTAVTSKGYLHIWAETDGVATSVATTEFTETGCISITGTIPDNATKVYARVQPGKTEGDAVTVAAAKLELCTTQTLAHKDENGNWVLNDPPPNKVLELAKCQRYIWQSRLAANGYFCYGFGLASNSTTLFIRLPLPTKMRSATPTVVYSGGEKFACFDPSSENWANTTHNITNVVIDQFFGDAVCLKLTTTGLTAGKLYICQTKGGFIQLDNEL